MIFAHCKQPKKTVGQHRQNVQWTDILVLTLTLHDSHTEVSTLFLCIRVCLCVCVCVSVCVCAKDSGAQLKSCAIAVPKEAAESETRDEDQRLRIWSSVVPRGSLLFVIVVVGLIFDFCRRYCRVITNLFY